MIAPLGCPTLREAFAAATSPLARAERERRAARPAWRVRDESGLAIACQSHPEAEREATELRRTDPATTVWVEELEQ